MNVKRSPGFVVVNRMMNIKLCNVIRIQYDCLKYIIVTVAKTKQNLNKVTTECQYNYRTGKIQSNSRTWSVEKRKVSRERLKSYRQ